MILRVNTQGNTDIIDITDKTEEVVEKENIKEGLVTLFVKGSTAALTTIEADKNLYQDLREVLEEIFPTSNDWKHHKTWGDKNGAAHLRAAMIGPSLTIPVISNKLFLGTWQNIVLIDFDTLPRQREIMVSCVKTEINV